MRVIDAVEILLDNVHLDPTEMANKKKQRKPPAANRRPNKKATVVAANGEGVKEKESNEHSGPTNIVASTSGEVKGLSNLGNTCFFNAVLQCLSQTQLLCRILCDDRSSVFKGGVISVHPVSNNDSEDESSLPSLRLTLETDLSILTSTFKNFLVDVHQQKSSVMNPAALFGQICKKAPRFRGFQQQDSHELLRYMLDAMRFEETRRIRTAVCHHFGLEPDNVKPDTLDPKMRRKIRAYGTSSQFTFVEQIFGGELLQIIRCMQCQHVSQRHEQFLDISLPIMDPKESKPPVAMNGNKDDSTLKVLERKEDKDVSGSNSKYQQKKAKQKMRKNAKGQRKSQNLNGDHAKDDSLIETNGPTETPQNCSTSDGDVAQMTDALSTTLVLNDSTTENNTAVEATAASIDSGIEMAANDIVGNGESCVVENGQAINGDKNGEQNGCMDSSTNATGDKVPNDCINSTTDLGSIACIESLQSGDADLDDRCSLTAYLGQFTSIELLNGKNKFGCGNCSKQAAKSLQNDITPNSPSSTNGLSSSSDGPTKRNRKDSNAVVYNDAEKRHLISSPPAVLTLHLKRFQQVGRTVRKIRKHVEFPLVLDISPYCCKEGKRYKDQQKILYSLYGVVCHSGGLSGGHYVAYVKVRPVNEQLASQFLLTSSFLGSNVEHAEDGDQLETSEGLDSSALGPSLGKWYFISDSHVSEVPESKVLASEAYLLFYERIF